MLRTIAWIYLGVTLLSLGLALMVRDPVAAWPFFMLSLPWSLFMVLGDVAGESAWLPWLLLASALAGILANFALLLSLHRTSLVALVESEKRSR